MVFHTGPPEIMILARTTEKDPMSVLADEVAHLVVKTRGSTEEVEKLAKAGVEEYRVRTVGS